MPVQSIQLSDKIQETVKKAVCARKKLSESRLGTMRSRWEDADKEHQIYVDERDADRLRKNEAKSKKRSEGYQYVDVHVPYSYAIMMSMHTYFCSVFLAKSPVLQFTARHGEPEMNVKAVEALMDYQTTIGGHTAPYYVWLLDASKYGIGIIWHYWSKEEIAVAKYVDEPIVRAGITFSKTKQTRKVAKIEGYEGNRLFNVRPQDYLPDPRVPLHSPHLGEFQGRKLFMDVNTLYRGKASGQYMNADKVIARAKGRAGESTLNRFETVSEDLPNPSADFGGQDKTMLDHIPCIEMVIELCPLHWELGNSEYPEKWVFVVAYDEILIEAHPYGALHGKFPGETIEIEADGYNLGSRGILEIAKPLNDTMNWLFNSHFYNVRKSLNGDIIYDPTRISTADIRDGGPGKRIRIKPEAYGEDIRKFLHVIPPDAAATQTNMRDLQVVTELMHRVTGVSASMLGTENAGGSSRKSATEIRASSSGSINRLKTSTEYMSALGFAPFAQMLLQNTQENYTSEKKFKLAGDLVENAEKFIQIDPSMIAGAFDYAAVDGTLPIDRFALVSMWTNFFTQLRNFPQIAQQYDMGKLFGHVAQLGGLKDVKQFRINVGAGGPQPGMIPMSELSNGGYNGGGGATPIGQGRGTANGAGDTPRLTVPG
jgi:hypothetical protein